MGRAQSDAGPAVAFTADLQHFQDLSGLKDYLKDVEIIALGENTHGLGEVFRAKTALVKFLHRELGFNLVLFESGYGDAALAWEQIASLSPKEYTSIFSSNFYYQTEELQELAEYAKLHASSISLQGFDCQPQQHYLTRRMAEILQTVDSALANSVAAEMRGFNNLYQFENDQDTLAFNRQRDRFIAFLAKYDQVLDGQEQFLLDSGVRKGEIEAIRKSNELFRTTYASVGIGSMMGWPISYNLRDKAMFETVMRLRDEHPESKIIIWAQNSHIENSPKPNYNVDWMGHSLKSTLGDRYYSIGAVVYSGENLNYNDTFTFEHSGKEYLAYHLNQFQKEKFVVDLRRYGQNDFTAQLLLGMENNGNTAEFIAKDRFDGLLFLKYSGIPKLLGPE